MGSGQSRSKKTIAAKNAEIERLKKEKEAMEKKLRKVKREKRELEKEKESAQEVEELSDDLLNCSLCCYAYSKTSHIPTVGTCGHTICSQCAGKLPNRHCPICRAVGSFIKPSKNFFACDLLLQNKLLKEVQINSLKPPPANTILLIGGSKCSNGQHNMTILSQNRSKWIEIQLELPYSVSGSGAIYLNEEIYLIGGFAHPKITYKLDKNLKWIRLADMNAEHGCATNSCLEWNGYIWVFGGMDEEFKASKTVERYDPKTNKWTLMPDMNYARCGGAAAVWKDRIIITGGEGPKFNLTGTVEYFYQGNDNWTNLPPMKIHSKAHSLVSYKEKLITLGGITCNSRRRAKSNAVWELNLHDPIAIWKPLPAMKFAAFSFGGIVLDEEIYAIGGNQESTKNLDRVEIFNGENWRAGPSLPYPMSYMSTVIIPQNLADRLSNVK